ncbi:MAG TPA: penicillin-binding protein 2 [Roseiflexaceae bacterium]|nr:penicillin-binding protein 2 [Roseiflexaceae bacterium]
MAVRSKPSNRAVTLSRWRISAILCVVLLIAARIGVQLGNLQVVQHESLSGRAKREFDYTKTIQPSRGLIRDSRGNVLALDVDRESLFAIPQLVQPEEAPKLALILSSLLGEPAPKLQDLLSNREMSWVAIKRWLKPEVSSAIGKLIEEAGLQDQDLGLRLVHEPRRVYPQGEFGAHVVGAVNFEGVGISGVEGFYDTQLKGITGTISAEWDASDRPIWLTPPELRPPSNGADLELTLDPLVQHVLETELKRAYEEHSADSVTGIVMDPRTGAIRGMASFPSFDPNRYNEFSEELYNLNPAIGRVYEPGSTFKIATIAAGLNAGAFTPETQVNDTGVIFRYGRPLQNFDGAGHGMITPAKVLYYSSNVGALLFNEMTGPQKFYKTLGDFGYGKPTGIDLAGESPGLVNSNYTAEDWSPIVLDTNAYGQGIAVTPLQQVRMVAAIANDGKLMRPYIVQKRCRGEVCDETRPQQVGQPVKPEVAQQVRRMLINSANTYAPVVWGPITGSYQDTWLVPGFEVAAKTGTSSVPDGRGGYTDWTIGSVAGLAPVENARYAILVKIDHPKDDIWGVRTAIPVYHAIVDQLLRYDRIPPDPAKVGEGQTIGMITP